MDSFTVEILDDEGAMCTLYTVRKSGAAMTEIEKFFNKRLDSLRGFDRAFQELANLLTNVIGSYCGAIPELFREEREAVGLPPKGEWEFDEITVSYRNFPLRLYCLRIATNKLVVFNGDQKTSDAAQSGNTRTTFLEAQHFAKKIKEALRNNELDFDSDEIIIY